MRTISRHLLARQAAFFASGLVVLMLIGACVEILVHLDDAVEQHGRAGGVLAWLGVRVPARYAHDAIPAAAFASVFLCVGLAARARETTALAACGVAPARIAAPLLLAAGALSVATLLLNETWLLDARRAAARLGSTAAAEREPFWYHSGNRLYNVAEPGKDGRLRDVAIFDLDPQGRLLAATHAPEALETPDGWRLSEGSRLRFDPTAPAAAPEIEAPAPLERGAPRLSAAGESLDLHARLAHPASVFLFALLALPLALGGTHAPGLARPALVGVGLLALFHGLDAASLEAARRAWVPGWAGAWLAPAVLAGLGLVGLARARP